MDKIANIRGSFFTNKPVEIDFTNSSKIIAALNEYHLFAFPINGFSFQIGPSGMIPFKVNNYGFRNSDASLSITIGPDRVDVSICNSFDNTQNAFEETKTFCLKVLDAFHSCVNFKETRLALASTWILASRNLDQVSKQLLGEDVPDNLIEWNNRRVERKALDSICTTVNYGHQIVRGQVKLPTELMVSDRIVVETDINTIPLPQGFLNKEKDDAFFNNAVLISSEIVDNYYKKI